MAHFSLVFFLTQSEDDFFFVTDYLNYTEKWKLIQNSTQTANNCYCFKYIPFRHLSWPISILLLALDVIYYSGFVIWMQNMWIFSCFPLVCRFITTFPICFWCIIFIIIQFKLFFNSNFDFEGSLEVYFITFKCKNFLVTFYKWFLDYLQCEQETYFI